MDGADCLPNSILQHEFVDNIFKKLFINAQRITCPVAVTATVWIGYT